MLFHTPEFLVLLLISLVLFYAFPHRRIYILAAANLIFYTASGTGFLLLFLLMTIITYYGCKLLGGRYGKWALCGIILLNAGNLIFFKYSLFAIRNLEKIFSLHLLTEHSFWLTIMLPVGISFYTFEFISYAVDVYKKKSEPARSLLEFWMFISFFAHLIAGPIMRGREFLPQVEKLAATRLKQEHIRLGCFYFGLGLVKKMVLADPLADLVDGIFSYWQYLPGSGVWVTSYLFAFQIYYDFSAYSDMAIGLGYLFGLKLPQNFMTPYLSGNASEFWRRWHITLSSWIRDYIYIPLGGSRYGELRKYAALFIAMTVSGIWHGALWMFILWGMYYGALAILHNLYVKLKSRLGLEWLDSKRLYRFATVFIFFHLTCIGWVMFRIHERHTAFILLKRMLSVEAFHLPDYMLEYLLMALGLYALHIVEHWLLAWLPRISGAWHRFVPAPVRAVGYSLLIVMLVLKIRHGGNGFIYFQF